MSTPDLAVIAAAVCYLATVGAGLAVALAYRRQVRVSSPPKQAVQQQDAAEQPASVPVIGRAS